MMDIVEFFVMRKYRRSGAGEAMARSVFDRFPGRWEVREIASNLPAQAFWRTIIGRYTDGRFEERTWDDEKWRGPVQFFDSRDRARREHRHAATKSPIDRLRKICMALPEATEKLAWGEPTFRAGANGKMFVMFSNNHHNDGRIAAHCASTHEIAGSAGAARSGALLRAAVRRRAGVDRRAAGGGAGGLGGDGGDRRRGVPDGGAEKTTDTAWQQVGGIASNRRARRA